MQSYSPNLSPIDMLLENSVLSDEAPEELPPMDQEFCTAFDYSEMKTSVQVYTFVFVALFVISVVGLLFIATTILYSEKLQSHP